MAAIISLLVIITLSVLITRIASTALIHTGLSKESATFQARSAFTGVGFTTSESENIVNHPIRRKIIFVLFFLGNVGLISTISSLILSFGSTNTLQIAILFSGLAVLWMLAQSEWIEQKLSHIINRLLNRYTTLDIHDYYSLLHLSDNYRVSELNIDEGDWLAEKTLSKVKLRDEGVIVLGVKRDDGDYIGAPRGQTKVYPGDTLVLYGRAALLESLDERTGDAAGDKEHDDAVIDQNKILADQKDTKPPY